MGWKRAQDIHLRFVDGKELSQKERNLLIEYLTIYFPIDEKKLAQFIGITTLIVTKIKFNLQHIGDHIHDIQNKMESTKKLHRDDLEDSFNHLLTLNQNSINELNKLCQFYDVFGKVAERQGKVPDIDF